MTEEQRALASQLYADALRRTVILRSAARPLAWGLHHVNGDVVRAARYARVLLQEDAADMLDLTRPDLSRMEQGRYYVSEALARKLARVFFNDEQRWRDFVDMSSDEQLAQRNETGADPFDSHPRPRARTATANRSKTLDASA